MTVERETVDRREAAFILGITDAEFEAWLSDSSAKEFAAGKSKIPQMPHIPGRPVRFHLPTLRTWFLTYFLKGGERRAVS
jgi:hypothetical protein